VSMTWRAKGLADTARHVIGCHLTQETRVQNACRWRGGQCALRQMLPATAYGAVEVRKRGFTMRWMTWRELSTRP